MESFDLVLALLVVVAVLVPLAKRLDVPVAIAHVIGGGLLAFIPAFRAFQLEPSVAFSLFIPPMLYWAALRTSGRDLARNARPLLLLAVFLVLFTELGVAFVAQLVLPGIGWGPAFVLGAIVAPPDAAVVTAIAHRLGIPRRLVDLLEGETLLNDSTALVTYNVAVAAVVTGFFSFGSAALQFSWAVVGGVLEGYLLAWVVVWLRRRAHHTEVENTISLLTPFAAFLPAEHLGASGVLAVLTCGLTLNHYGPPVVSARTRLQGRSMWSVLTFVLEGLMSLLIGLNLGTILINQAKSFDRSVAVATLIISLVVIGLRMVWMFPATYLPRILSRRIREREGWPAWRRTLFMGWAGLRGGDTLVTALALPLVTANGAPFPYRETIASLGFGVIFVTLVLQGLTLRPLVRLLKLTETDHSLQHEELLARRHATQAGHEALLKAAKRLGIDDALLARFTNAHHHRSRGDATHDLKAFQHATEVISQIDRETLAAERSALIGLRNAGTIRDEVLRRIQHELDLEELRISGDTGESNS